MSGNPFRPAEQVAPKVKCLVYGASGLGKTYLALTAPGPIAVIDTEGGTAFYANRVGHGGLSRFDVLPTKTFAQVEQAVAYLRANPDAYQTLVIDPVTVLYETLQDAAQEHRSSVRRNAEADLEMLDWQRIKRAYKRLMTDLVNLPMHVVVTAREADLTEEVTGGNGRKERRKIGFKPDAEKSTPYYFDTTIRLVPHAKGRAAVVEKDRTGVHPLNAQVVNPSFADLFSRAIASEGTAERGVQSDAAAARMDSLTTMAYEEMHDRDETETPMGYVVRQGVIAAGEGIRSSLSAIPTPDGPLLGFLLAVEGAKQRPQCVAIGPVAQALIDLSSNEPETLAGAPVEVEGELYEVTRPGRSKLYRIRLARITGPDWTFPAPEVDEPTEPTEAPSIPLFSEDEEAAIDRALGVA